MMENLKNLQMLIQWEINQKNKTSSDEVTHKNDGKLSEPEIIRQAK